MFWTDASTTSSFTVGLPATPIGHGIIRLQSRNTIDGSNPNRLFWLDYEEIFAAAYMRATGVDISSASSVTKASLDFALLAVKVWGPASVSASVQLRCDADASVSGYTEQDTPGRNHRATVGCTFPAIGWRKFGSIDATTPAVLVSLLQINFLQFAPQAAGTTFGLNTSLDMGEIQLSVRIRYKLSVTSTTTMKSGKGSTIFESETNPS